MKIQEDFDLWWENLDKSNITQNGRSFAYEGFKAATQIYQARVQGTPPPVTRPKSDYETGMAGIEMIKEALKGLNDESA